MTAGRGRFWVVLVGAMGPLMIGAGACFHAPVAHASSKTEREQGAALFHEKGCEHCHGINGIGGEKGPVLSGVGRTLHKPEIERQIREGGKEMPAFAEALSNDEVEQLVAYLAAKKKKVKKLAPTPAVLSSQDSKD
jgi:mono/diheme cytochrome c family protein